MKIDHTTPLHAIAERMGDCATRADAAAMRSILVRANVIDTDDVPEADWLRYCDEAASVTTAATAYYWRVYHATSGADLGVYAGPTQDDAIRAYTQATDDSESAGAYSAEPESGGWTVCLTDGREIAVPAELDEDIVRYGVSAIVEWAREAGWAADGRRVRTIGTPDGQGITQF